MLQIPNKCPLPLLWQLELPSLINSNNCSGGAHIIPAVSPSNLISTVGMCSGGAVSWDQASVPSSSYVSSPAFSTLCPQLISSPSGYLIPQWKANVQGPASAHQRCKPKPDLWFWTCTYPIVSSKCSIFIVHCEILCWRIKYNPESKCKSHSVWF